MKNWHDWNPKKVSALLSKIYKFLRDSDISIYFSTNLCRYDDSGENDVCDGFVSMIRDPITETRTPDAIHFDPRPSQPLLTVFIHELVHALYPKLEEYQTAHIAEQVTLLLSDKQATNIYKRVIDRVS